MYEEITNCCPIPRIFFPELTWRTESVAPASAKGSWQICADTPHKEGKSAIKTSVQQ